MRQPALLSTFFGKETAASSRPTALKPLKSLESMRAKNANADWYSPDDVYPSTRQMHQQVQISVFIAGLPLMFRRWVYWCILFQMIIVWQVIRRVNRCQLSYLALGEFLCDYNCMFLVSYLNVLLYCSPTFGLLNVMTLLAHLLRFMFAAYRSHQD